MDAPHTGKPSGLLPGKNLRIVAAARELLQVHKVLLLRPDQSVRVPADAVRRGGWRCGLCRQGVGCGSCAGGGQQGKCEEQEAHDEVKRSAKLGRAALLFCQGIAMLSYAHGH